MTQWTKASTRRGRALVLLHLRAPAPRSRSRFPATATSAEMLLPSALHCFLCCEFTRPVLSLRGALLLDAERRTAGAVELPNGLLAGAGSRWRLRWLEQLNVVLHEHLVVENRRRLGEQTRRRREAEQQALAAAVVPAAALLLVRGPVPPLDRAPRARARGP